MERGPTNEQLMAEMAWVRRLARALVRDDAAAEDIAQDTWIVAAEQQPETDRSLRPWLARVVGNLVHTRRRSQARRHAREIAVEDARSVLTPAELVERVELQRVVSEEVLALAEPYRSTVLLHFFEGISSADLAQRLGIPAGTVRRRLKVGLDQLREALRRRSDPPERGWLAALAPIAIPTAPASHAPIAVGVVVMKKLVAIFAVLIVLIGAGLWWRHRGRADRAAVGSVTTHASTPLVRQDAASRLPAWLAQDGAPARLVAGQVVAGGKTVPGATVKLALQLGASALEPIAEVTTGADGAFSFGPQPAALVAVSASAPNLAPASLAVALADPHVHPDQLVLELTGCRTSLIGTVTDAGHGPIAHARVQTAGLGGTETDASGHYRACIAPVDEPGTAAARVRVEADGYGTVEERVIVVGELHHDFVLAPEAVLVGTVTAAGHPVAGARVIAVPAPGTWAGDAAASTAASGADGTFRIAGLAPAKFQLSAYAERLGSARPIIATARPAKTSPMLRVELSPLARVKGRVVTSGAPVAGVHVGIAQHAEAAAISQADGSFVLDHVPFGAATLVAPPYSVVAPKTIAVIAANVDDVEVELGKLGRIHGRVTRHGQPIAGGNVMCNGDAGTYATKSAAEGTYTLDGLPAAMLGCTAWGTDERAFTVLPPFALAANEDKLLDFVLDSAGRIQGTVVDEVGAGVAGVYVRFDLANDGGDVCEATTDPHGVFDCTSLAGGDYTGSVTPSPGARQPFAPANGAFATVHVPKDAAVTGVTLAIQNRRLAIRGTVVDDTGAALPDVHVRAIGRGLSGMSLPSALSDGDGRFEIPNLAPGSYNLDARGADGQETELLAISAGAEGVAITLPRVGAIVGTLVGFASPPHVRAITAMTDMRVGAEAIVDGTTFSVGGLTPGHYIVEAQAGAQAGGVTADVRAGETAHATLTSRPVGKLAVHVTDFATHAPVANMRCDANLSIDGQMGAAPEDPARIAYTDGAGRAAVDAPIGRVRLWCFFPTGGPMSQAGTDVDVAATNGASAEVVSVRATFGGAPGDPGFALLPLSLPPTVGQVDPHGPAAAALAVGDRIVTVDGASLQGMVPQGVMMLVMNHAHGSTAVLGIERAGVARDVSIVIGGGS